MAAKQTALVVIRAWIEEDSDRPLRVHLRLSHDLANGFERDETVTEVEVVCDSVRDFLERILSAP